MPEIPLGASTHKRKTTWNPEVRALNYLAEISESNQFNGVDHVQRPGLSPFATVGTGPIRAVFRQAGTFNGDFLVVSGTTWYRVTQAAAVTSIGTISGTDRSSIAATATRAITVANTQVRSTNGTTTNSVAMPDGRPAGSVAQLNGYFIISEENSARFYWIEPGQTNPDALSFATTESTPGYIIKVERVGDELWFFKEEGLEVWVPTGDADLPFQRQPGRNYDRGCRARDTIVRFDNSVAWVGNDGIVYRGENSPIRISDHSIEEQIRKSDLASLSAWSFAVDGHTVLSINMQGGTYAYDLANPAPNKWSEFSSYERDFWRAHLGDAGETFTLAGDDELGLVYKLDPERSNDNGEPMVRRVTGGVAVPGGTTTCDNLVVYVTTGTATDPNADPKMMIRWSDDMQTYNDPRLVSLKRQGNYSKQVRINRLGVIRSPGRLFDFIVTDDVVATISAAAYNVPLR